MVFLKKAYNERDRSPKISGISNRNPSNNILFAFII